MERPHKKLAEVFVHRAGLPIATVELVELVFALSWRVEALEKKYETATISPSETRDGVGRFLK